MAKTRVFEHSSDPQHDPHDFVCSKSSKRSYLKRGLAIELPDGSLHLRPPLDPAKPSKPVYNDGSCYSGTWHAGMSAHMTVMKFDPLRTP